MHSEPGLFKATAEFVQLLATVPDPVLQVARKAATPNGKIAWTLLGTALFQDCTYSEINALLNALYAKFPDDRLWTLPVPKAADIDECVGNSCWSLAEHVAGIFWSVGLFVRRHENLQDWLQSRTPAELWRDLGEIYFMGKGNPRPKACAAIYRLLSPAPVGLNFDALPSSTAKQSTEKLPPLPLTMGARRYLAFLGPAADCDFAELGAREKQKLANELFVALAEPPYVASHSLQFFLETGKDDFICRSVTDHCKKCPLYEYCGYAERSDK